MSDSGMSKRDEIEMLLPFYESGDLEGEELALVEAWLADDPDAEAALEAVRAEKSSAFAANDNIVAPADALQRFEQALDAEVAHQRQVAMANTVSSATGWLERLLPSWLIPAPAPALALCTLLLAALVGQTVYYNSADSGLELAGGETAAVDGARLIVVFKPDASIEAITSALRKADAVIVAGPKAGGLFEIVVRDRETGTVDARTDALAEEPIVATVQRLKADEAQ